MKSVFTSAELPHQWAAQHAPHGRSPSALSFQGDILRSYATDIGRIIQGPVSFVVLNETHYSQSTSKHQSAMRSAVSHYRIKLRVGGLDRGEVLRRLTPAQLILAATLKAGETAEQAAKVRNQVRREELTKDVAEDVATINAAMVFWKLRRKPLTPDTLLAVCNRFHAKRTKEENQRRKDEQARAEAHLAATRRWEEERRELARKHLPVWQAGGPDVYGFNLLPVALRVVSEDGRDTVETSHGARVLLKDALRLFQVCQRCASGGYSWVAPVSGNFSVGPYRLESIDAQGNATVGCHSLPFAEMQRLFETLTDEQKGMRVGEEAAK